MMTPVCVTVQMATLETTVKVSLYVIYMYGKEVYSQYVYDLR